MLKICFVLLTLASGEPTMINFNEVSAVNQSQRNAVGWEENKVYFTQTTSIGSASIVVKETVEQIAEKVKRCSAQGGGNPFIYVIE